MEQTPLDMQNRLKEISGKEVLLMLTNNSQRIISIKESSKGSIALRAHKMFLQAEEHVITALGKWLKGDSRQKTAVKDFINSNIQSYATPAVTNRKTIIKPHGKYYNLEELATRINTCYLDNRSTAPVTWGRKVTKRNPSTIRLGWYDPTRKIITLSQRLDRKDIPYYMVEYVLFHEMLHEVIGIETGANGRRNIHSKKFNLMEQTYPYYNEAIKFEKQKWGGV